VVDATVICRCAFYLRAAVRFDPIGPAGTIRIGGSVRNAWSIHPFGIDATPTTTL